MAKDFASDDKKRYLKGPTVTKVEKSSNSNLLRISIYLSILCGLVTCLFLLYIQNGMQTKFNFSRFTSVNTFNPKFEFYKILSTSDSVNFESNTPTDVKTLEAFKKPEKLEEINSINSINSIKTTTQEINKTLVLNNINWYLLQIAAFKDYNDAENLRSKLLLTGIDVDIYSIKLSENNVWYRVRSKKSQSLSDIKLLQEKLLVFNLNAIILKEIS